MSPDSVQAVILSEDTQLECFVRRFLIKQGWSRRQIRTETLPKGTGSGEQYVRERFVSELKAYRSRSARAATCLIVATDADNRTVEDRIGSFRDVCQGERIPFRDQTERVVFIVPKRNIETWLAYLRGEVVDEIQIYRKYTFESECGNDVTRLDQMCREQRLEPEPPKSLQSACDEYKRITKK